MFGGYKSKRIDGLARSNIDVKLEKGMREKSTNYEN